MNPTTVGNVFLVMTTIPAIAAVAVFSRVQWWHSRWGIHLMAYMAVMAVVCLVGDLKILIGVSGAFPYIRATLLGAVFVVVSWRFWFVLQAHREGSPNETASHPPTTPRSTP